MTNEVCIAANTVDDGVLRARIRIFSYDSNADIAYRAWLLSEKSGVTGLRDGVARIRVTGLGLNVVEAIMFRDCTFAATDVNVVISHGRFAVTLHHRGIVLLYTGVSALIRLLLSAARQIVTRAG